MRKLILFYFLVLISSNIYSQNKDVIISGYVRDSLSAEALVGVTIVGASAGTTTNNYGFYSISCKKTDDILVEFYYMGYNPVSKRIPISKFKKEGRLYSYNLNIEMKGLAIDLSEVVFTDRRPAISAVEPLGKVSVNSSQLKYIPSFMGEQDIFKFLQLLPGVSAGKEASTGLSVRGGSTDQTLILLDDIPIYNHSHAFGFVSIFSGETIKSAELYKGYLPPNYGGRLSGVASMIMRDGNRNEHKQSLQIGTTTASGTLEGPINNGKGSYLVNARLFTPALVLKIMANTSNNSFFGFYDATVKANYDLTKNTRVYLNFYSGGDEFIFSAKGHNSTNDTITKSKSGLSWGNLGSSVRLSSKLNNKTFFNTTIYYSYLHNNKIANYNIEEGGIETKNEESTTFSAMHEIGVKTLLDHNISNWYKLFYGFDFAYQSFTPMNTFTLRDGLEIKDEYDNRGLASTNFFLNNNFKFGKFGINLGARLGIYSNLNQVVVKAEPRVSLFYNMQDASLWISYVKNTQPLFSMNQHYYSLPIDYWIPFTEKDIIPTSQQIALGYKQKIGGFLDISTEIYYKKSKDISLIYDVDEFLLEGGGYDIAKNEAYGFELMAQYQHNRLGLMGSYTFSSSQYNVDDKWFPFVYDTPHNLNLFGSYDVLRQENKTHTFSCNINYKTGLPYILSNEVYDFFNSHATYTGTSGVIINNSLYSNIRLKGYFRMDVNYSMEKKLKKGSRIWQISILNLTGYKNPYVVYAHEGSYKGLTLIPFLPSFSYKRVF